MSAGSPLILASASPRRRELLASLDVAFTVEVADVTEWEDRDCDPRKMVAHNAALKADWVAQRHPQAFVLGADTTVFVGNDVLNKPANHTEAVEMLHQLRGKSHTVYTGMALRHENQGIAIDRGVESRVYFHDFDDATIESYLAKVHTLDKAGGYAIQEHGEMIVSRHDGSFSNIVGLPLDETKQILAEIGLLD